MRPGEGVRTVSMILFASFIKYQFNYAISWKREFVGGSIDRSPIMGTYSNSYKHPEAIIGDKYN